MEWPRIEIFAGLSATADRKRADVIRGGEREREGEGRSLVLRGGVYRWVYYRESICATSCRSEETWRAVGERARTHPVLVNLSSVISSARARARIHVHIRSPGSCPSTACP